MTTVPDVRALLAAGQNDEAARVLREAGALREAAEVLAQIWRYADAVDLALRSDRPDTSDAGRIASRCSSGRP